MDSDLLPGRKFTTNGRTEKRHLVNFSSVLVVLGSISILFIGLSPRY